MATQIYLGMPPENIKNWIIENYGNKESSPLTKITFLDGTTKEYDIFDLSKNTLRDNNIMDWNSLEWQWYYNTHGAPIEIKIGTNVKTVESECFSYCTSLRNIVIPITLTDLGNTTFFGCSNLNTAIFEGRTISQVQSMDGYAWGFDDTGTTVCCIDGDITDIIF